jgi:hypothetical protein
MVACRDGRRRASQRSRAWGQLLVGVGALATVTTALAENWKFSASASATETYTSNVDYTSGSLAEGDFATTLGATLNINGEGARFKLNGSIGAYALFYVTETQNNSFAPNVNLTGTLEAIENFAYVDASAFVTQTFSSPFGAQPSDLVNATQNRYTQQTYTVSPYIKGVFGSSNISYRLRFDNYWTIASSFGDSSTAVPGTYANNLTGSMSSPVNPWGWTLEYKRLYYDNGLSATVAKAPTRRNKCVCCCFTRSTLSCRSAGVSVTRATAFLCRTRETPFMGSVPNGIRRPGPRWTDTWNIGSLALRIRWRPLTDYPMPR